MDLRVIQFEPKRVHAVADWLQRSRRTLATGLLFLLALPLGFHVVFGTNGWAAYQKRRAENRALQQEIQKLQQENDALDQRVKALHSDPKTIEKEAREHLGYARPGEMIYVVPEQRPPQPPAAGMAQKQKP